MSEARMTMEEVFLFDRDKILDTFSSHNIFNFLPFTLSQLSKCHADAIQTTAAETELSESSSHKQVTFLVLSSKAVQKNPAEPLWFCQVNCDRSDFASWSCYCPFPRSICPSWVARSRLESQPILWGTGLTGRWRWVMLGAGLVLGFSWTSCRAAAPSRR